MAKARPTKRGYSPKSVDDLRVKTVGADQFDALLATELKGVGPSGKKTAKGKTATTKSTAKAVDGLSKKDIDELRDHKRRAAAARQRAKARSGRLIFE